MIKTDDFYYFIDSLMFLNRKPFYFLFYKFDFLSRILIPYFKSNDYFLIFI